MLNINLCGGFWILSNLIFTQIRLKSRHQLQFWAIMMCPGGWWYVSSKLKVNKLLLLRECACAWIRPTSSALLSAGHFNLGHLSMWYNNFHSCCTECMYTLIFWGEKHAFEHYIVLTKMKPFNIQFGVKRLLNIPKTYSFGQKHTLEYTVSTKLF